MFRWQASSSAQVRGLRVPRQTGRNRASACCLSGRSGTKVGALSPVEAGLRLGDHRAGPGFGPGAAKRQTQDASPWTVEAEPRLRPGKPAVHGQGFGGGTGRRRSEPRFRICRAANRQGFGPDGEPAGKPEGAQAPEGLRRTAPEPPAQVRPRNSPKRTASPPRLGDPRRGTVGAGGNVSPHFLFGPHFLSGAPSKPPSHPLAWSCWRRPDRGEPGEEDNRP